MRKKLFCGEQVSPLIRADLPWIRRPDRNATDSLPATAARSTLQVTHSINFAMLSKLQGKTLVIYDSLPAVEQQVSGFMSSMTYPGSTKQMDLQDLESAPGESFENVAVFGCGLSSLSLGQIMSALKPNGAVFLVDCRSTESRTLTRLCLFAGFVDVSGSAGNQVCKKPSWSVVKEPEPACETKPKACKNCSCGRKEAEEQGVSEEEMKRRLESGEVNSSCGSCYLGDEFRCASCPYRGMPAFKPGDKVTLGGFVNAGAI